MEQGVTASNLASNLSHSEKTEDQSYVHPSCVIDSTVSIGRNVKIHPKVVIDRSVKIGDGVEIFSGCYIAEDCSVGDQTVLRSMVTLREKTRVGKNVIIESGVVIGSDGFGYAKERNGINCKVPQVGYVVIGDDVRIGANTTIDRATLGETRIAKGSRVGSLAQIGHNVIIGENSVVGDSVGLCGSCKIGSKTTIGHGVGMVGHIKIGNNARVSDGAGVSKDIQDGDHIIGVPGLPESDYIAFQKSIEMLPELAKRIQLLEKQIGRHD